MPKHGKKCVIFNFEKRVNIAVWDENKNMWYYQDELWMPKDQISFWMPMTDLIFTEEETLEMYNKVASAPLED